MNKGIDMATGRWLYFMGADDRLLPGFNELAGSLKDNNTVYYGNSVAFFENGNSHHYGLLQGEFSPYRLAKYCMNHQSILYPAKAFQPHRYDLKYKVAADYAFNLRLWGDRQFKREFYPLDVVRYNMGGYSAGKRDVAFYKDKSSLIRKEMGWKIYSRYIIRAVKDLFKGREGV
jgi:glycosyltransferase involved in cell wall biosynthesis